MSETFLSCESVDYYWDFFNGEVEMWVEELVEEDDDSTYEF